MPCSEMIELTVPHRVSLIAFLIIFSYPLGDVIRQLFNAVKRDLGYDNVEPDDIAYIETMAKKRFDEKGNLIPLDERMIKGSILAL